MSQQIQHIELFLHAALLTLLLATLLFRTVGFPQRRSQTHYVRRAAAHDSVEEDVNVLVPVEFCPPVPVEY